MENTSKGKMVIDTNAKPLTPETAIRCVFGISLDSLIRDIRENKGGRYDSLYI